MSSTDYLVDIALVAIIFLQVRPHELTVRSARLSLIAVAVVAGMYVHHFTPRGEDLELVVVLSAIGAGVGLLSGLATRVWRTDDGRAFTQTGVLAVVLWLAGMGSRFWFAYWANHSGAESVARFSIHHQISGGPAWTAALVGMACAQVLFRVGVLQYRRAVVLDVLSAAPPAERVGAVRAASLREFR